MTLEASLTALFRAIADGDVAHVSDLLDAFPHLAVEQAATGATRAAAAPFYLEQIEHYFFQHSGIRSLEFT